MPKIRVERQHTLGQDEALKRAHDIVRDLGERLKATIEWIGPDATFKGTGFTGSASVAADSIAVAVDLSLLLSPIKGKVETRLQKALEEKFS